MQNAALRDACDLDGFADLNAGATVTDVIREHTRIELPPPGKGQRP
jgi:hypothetical protein